MEAIERWDRTANRLEEEVKASMSDLGNAIRSGTNLPLSIARIQQSRAGWYKWDKQLGNHIALPRQSQKLRAIREIPGYGDLDGVIASAKRLSRI
jgi:hypothetical protein